VGQMKRGGVQSKYYVLHIDNPNKPGFVWCGRKAQDVNRTTEPEKLILDEGCRRCVAARLKGGG